MKLMKKNQCTILTENSMFSPVFTAAHTANGFNLRAKYFS